MIHDNVNILIFERKNCSKFFYEPKNIPNSGVVKFPDPVTDFHALYVSDSEVELAWEPVLMPDKDEEVVHYEIYFKELKNNSDSGSPFDHESVSSLKKITTNFI